MSNNKKQVNRSATIINIMTKAKGKIKDPQKVQELLQTDEDIILDAQLWGAEIVYH
jgi:hypothetical protein